MAWSDSGRSLLTPGITVLRYMVRGCVELGWVMCGWPPPPPAASAPAAPAVDERVPATAGAERAA
jgi:hypothetical protein